MIINLCIVILRDINESSQSSLALAGLAMKIDGGIQNNETFHVGPFDGFQTALCSYLALVLLGF